LVTPAAGDRFFAGSQPVGGLRFARV